LEFPLNFSGVFAFVASVLVLARWYDYASTRG
jgi:hypothetical protein